MSIDSKFYLHPSDRAALKALKAIPGFQQLMKFFMSIWNEKLFRIENMSSNLRVNDNQMKKYYDMLPPICDKLGIEIPELYIKMDVQPNAYTYGDTKPFIVLTSGLLERFPDDLVAPVIAHECGHIACHHTLYSTMGRILLNGTLTATSGLGAAQLISESLSIAFYYWMRCSEFSADRAAIICDGGSEDITRMCMHFSGYDPRFNEEANLEEFMSQAQDYSSMMTDSKVNKLLEFYMYKSIDHPLNSVRAFEAKKWADGEDAKRVFDYLENGQSEILDTFLLPVPDSAKKLCGQDREDVKNQFLDAGFENITEVEEYSRDKLKRRNSVLAVSINGNSAFADNDWFPANSPVNIHYKM
jgi:Zn-dependent protease with chaperone function